MRVRVRPDAWPLFLASGMGAGRPRRKNEARVKRPCDVDGCGSGGSAAAAGRGASWAPPSDAARAAVMCNGAEAAAEAAAKPPAKAVREAGTWANALVLWAGAPRLRALPRPSPPFGIRPAFPPVDNRPGLPLGDRVVTFLLLGGWAVPPLPLPSLLFLTPPLLPFPTAMSAPMSSPRPESAAPPAPSRLACPLTSLGDAGVGEARLGEAVNPGPERARPRGSAESSSAVRKLAAVPGGLRLKGMERCVVLGVRRVAS